MHPSTTTTLLTTLFFGLTAALPTTTKLHPRAGGPAIIPIPSTCVISNPNPSPSPADFLPTPSTSSASLYSAYYPSNSANTTQMAEQCLQQCYGYGDHTECKASFFAENVLIPDGQTGAGQLSAVCLLYTRALVKEDFEGAPEGQGTGAWTRNLAC